MLFNYYYKVLDRNEPKYYTSVSTTWARSGQSYSGLNYNIVQNGDGSYLITLDVPGYSKEDVKALLKGNVLIVLGELPDSIASFRETFDVPDEIDTKNINAKLRHGRFEITLPVAEDEDEETIHIEVTD